MNITFRRRFGLVLIPAGAYGFLRWLEEDEDDEDDDEGNSKEKESIRRHGVQGIGNKFGEQGSEDEEEDEDEDEDDALLFLPIGHSGPDPRVKYTIDDPEWLENEQVKTNSQRRAKILSQSFPAVALI